MHGIVVWIQTVLIPTLGPFGLFVVAFFDSSFLSVPEINDVLVVTSSAAPPAHGVDVRARRHPGLAGRVLGALVHRPARRRGVPGAEVRARPRGPDPRRTSRSGTSSPSPSPPMLPPPMPFKIFVLSAGVFGVPYRRFAATLIVARGLRYAFWGVMGAAYGDEALALLKRFDRWFDDARGRHPRRRRGGRRSWACALYYVRRKPARPPERPSAMILAGERCTRRMKITRVGTLSLAVLAAGALGRGAVRRPRARRAPRASPTTCACTPRSWARSRRTTRTR